MTPSRRSIPARTLAEWMLRSERPYANPFADVVVNGTFVGPSGQSFTLPGFFDGDGTWRVRFNPNEAGEWRYRIVSVPADQALTEEGAFEATPASGRGFLQATPGEAWGFHDEAGEPVFIFGDTVYNLFGMAYCGLDIVSFLRRRAAQGFNQWQDRRTWPWGGSETAPRFDRFNLDYFAVVDRVMRKIEALDLRVELIMEGWGFEFPFNNRQVFLPEWEELWLRYLIARYDAFTCVGSWTPLNEYEYYPDGIFRHTPVADRWAIRISRWIKRVAQHGHLVTAHNGPRLPPFAARFATDPAAIDAILFQDWGTRGEEDGWLAAGIEDQIAASLAGWTGSAVLAEYGYEVNPALPLLIPAHKYCDADHTRRDAWRGAFCGLGIIHGFDNSWGMFGVLDRDQPGIAYLLHLRRFFTELVPFAGLRPAPDLIDGEAFLPGRKPLALATANRATALAYLPAGGEVRLRLPGSRQRNGRWFDPRAGVFADEAAADAGGTYTAPGGGGDRPFDWVLVLTDERLPAWWTGSGTTTIPTITTG